MLRKIIFKIYNPWPLDSWVNIRFLSDDRWVYTFTLENHWYMSNSFWVPHSLQQFSLDIPKRLEFSIVIEILHHFHFIDSIQFFLGLKPRIWLESHTYQPVPQPHIKPLISPELTSFPFPTLLSFPCPIVTLRTPSLAKFSLYELSEIEIWRGFSANVDAGSVDLWWNKVSNHLIRFRSASNWVHAWMMIESQSCNT